MTLTRDFRAQRGRRAAVLAVAVASVIPLTAPCCAGPPADAVASGLGGAREVVLTASVSPEHLPTPTRIVPRGPSRSALAGVVDVYARVPGATAAGTGIVLDPSGEVVTNNHVVAAATSIVATDPGTGRTYPAVLLGTDARRDIAVLRLLGTPDLPVAVVGDSDTVQIGDPVAVVGNAGGRGGAPTVTTGQVTGLRQSVIAQDEYSHQQRHLHGMIKVDAVVQAGDSGGPLLENAEVIGMATAAGTAGFAIPINTVIATAHRLGATTPEASAARVHRTWGADRQISLHRLLGIG